MSRVALVGRALVDQPSPKRAWSSAFEILAFRQLLDQIVKFIIISASPKLRKTRE